MRGHIQNVELADESIHQVVAKALDRVLRPIIRILIGRMSCSFLLEVVRRIYIDEARDHLARLNDRKVNSRELSMLTGEETDTIECFEQLEEALSSALGSTIGRHTHATDTVERIWKAGNPHLRVDYCIESMLMDRWRSDPQFSDQSGKPRELPVFGTGATFSSLVEACSVGSISKGQVYKLLAKLSKTGTVEVVNDSRVRMLHHWYQAWKPDEQALLESGSHSMARFASTISHNLNAGDGMRLLQRDRWSRRVRRQDVDELRELCVTSTEKHIAEIVQILEHFELYDDRREFATFGVGWYHWLAGHIPG